MVRCALFNVWKRFNNHFFYNVSDTVTGGPLCSIQRLEAIIDDCGRDNYTTTTIVEMVVVTHRFAIGAVSVFSMSSFVSLYMRHHVRSGVARWVARLTRKVEVLGSSPIKGPRCFLGQEPLPLLLSTGWFEERIRAWFHNRAKMKWGPYVWLTSMSNKPPSLNIVKNKIHRDLSLQKTTIYHNNTMVH